MVLFIVKGKNGVYPSSVLDGRSFYMKAQEIIFGKKGNRIYHTLNENIDNLSIEILEIDTDKEDINKKLAELYNLENSIGLFSPLYKSTIDKHYTKMYEKQNFDFYQNLCDNYNEEKIKEIIYLVIFRNASLNWVSAYFKMPVYDIQFMLEHLPIYYNYIRW